MEGLAGYGRIERYPAGTVLFRRGDPPDCLHVVVSGRLELVGLTVPPLESGDTVGELGVLLDQPRSATVRVIEDAELLVVDRAGLDRAMREEPELAADLARGLARRVRERSGPPQAPTRWTAVCGGHALEVAQLISDATGETVEVVSDDADRRDELDHVLVDGPSGRAQLTICFGPPPAGLAGRVIRCSADADGLRRAARWASGRAVGLALSSGGSKTVAHIGVVEVLREARVPIDAVAGTSGGALVAVGVAFGMDDATFLRSVRELAGATRSLRRFDINPLPRSALARGRRLHTLFDSWFPGKHLEHANIPVFTVSADLLSGEEVVIERGLAADAMRASMSQPVLLEPWRLAGRMLIDGAIVTPVPEAVLRNAGVGYVIASSVAGQERVAVQARRSPNVVRIVLRLLDSMERALLRAQEPHADVLIRPNLWVESTFDFTRMLDVRAAGVEAGRNALPAIETALQGLGGLR